MTASQRILFLVCAAAFAQPVKHLYVEPFTTASGKLREDVIAELRKQRSIVVVPSESGADAILGGGGEIWIKGYRSLNPRSGRLPSDGTPVYGGYLSVELMDPKGDTLWSDLVTPSSGADDVSKDLAKRIAKHVAEALEKGLAPLQTTPLPQPKTILNAAGATFPYPVYAKWFANYRRANPSVEIRYDAVGSGEGARRLLAGQVDFAASDDPHVVDDSGKYLLFPSVVGAVVPIVNLPGVAGDIRFTPETLADIFLGKITSWNDPRLVRDNRGLHLPDQPIVVVHRTDGSGTTYAFTDYLSRTNPEWKAQVGSGLIPKWPVGRGAARNDGVAKTVKEFGGSIGYVEYIYALQNHLSFGKVRNQHGEFVAASLETIADGYPIATQTWLIVPSHIPDDAKRTAIAGFLRWMLGPGQAQAAALGYLALPKDVVSKEASEIAKIH